MIEWAYTITMISMVIAGLACCLATAFYIMWRDRNVVYQRIEKAFLDEAMENTTAQRTIIKLQARLKARKKK